MKYLEYLFASVLLIIIDGIWLSFVAKNIFAIQVNRIQNKEMKLKFIPAVLSYLFLVFGLTKNSLFEGPGIFFIILIFITCLIRGFLGFILGEWYKNRLDNSKKK